MIRCVGGAAVDRSYRLHAAAVLATSNPAAGRTGAGGVARNVAAALARLGVPAGLVSCVGDDVAGRALVAGLRAAGVDVAGVRSVPGARTAEYVAVLDPGGDLVIGVADMAVLDAISPADVDRAWPAAGGWAFADTNLSAATLAHVVARARDGGAALAVDAVSTVKAARLPPGLTGVAALFLNAAEAAAVAGEAEPAELARRLRRAGAERVVVTLGADGLLAAEGDAEPVHVPAEPVPVVDVTGAGDALVAGTLAALRDGAPLTTAAAAGTRLAARTVASPRGEP